MIFKWLSLKQTKPTFLEAESPALDAIAVVLVTLLLTSHIVSVLPLINLNKYRMGHLYQLQTKENEHKSKCKRLYLNPDNKN